MVKLYDFVIFFFKTNPWFRACFKFLMYYNFLCIIIYYFLSCKLAKVFWLYQLSLFQAKTVHDYEVHLNHQDTEYPLPEDILHYFFHCNFMKFAINSERSSIPLKSIYWQFLWNCLTIQIASIPIFKIWLWRFYIVIIICHAFIISFCIS